MDCQGGACCIQEGVIASQIGVHSTYVTSHNPLLYATSSSLTISTVLFREADSTSARVYTRHETRSVWHNIVDASQVRGTYGTSTQVG